MQVSVAPPALPATQWLGYGLNMTTLAPSSVDAVQGSILHGFRLFNLDGQTHSIQVGLGLYTVPNNVHVDITPSVHSSYHTYESGSLAASALQNDTNLAISYLAVSLNGSASHSVQKCFEETAQYALYNENSCHHSVAMKDYGDHINERSLKRRINALPKPFTPSLETIKQYKGFFAMFGSHVITAVKYGARFQIRVSSSTENSEINSNFSMYVKAAFNGILSAGEFNSSIKTSDLYHTFRESMQVGITVRGGDHERASLLIRDPSNPDIYRSWVDTHPQHADLVGVQTQEIWNIMQIAEDPEIIDAAQHIQDAYAYIVAHPVIHVTPVQLTISSDWGSFYLLSPDAVISEDPNDKKDYRGTTSIASKTAGWHHDSPTISTVRFTISNDGSPIHFSTGHGDAGGKPGLGRAEVVMNGKSYINDTITGDGWNLKTFYNCSVNPKSLEAGGSAG